MFALASWASTAALARSIDSGKAVLVDATGYGARGRQEWGELFDRYIDNRVKSKR